MGWGRIISKRVKIEPIRCVLCGLDPISALKAGISPAVLAHPGWIQCACRGPRPYNVAEALSSLKEKSESDQLRDEILRCWFEDVNRDHEPGGSSSSPGRKKIYSDIRPEQEWIGFSQRELAETERLEHLTQPIKGSLPAFLMEQLKRELETTESRYIRWLIFKHLRNIDAAQKVGRKFRSQEFKFLVTPQNELLWNAKKSELQCTSAELLAAILIKEWT